MEGEKYLAPFRPLKAKKILVLLNDRKTISSTFGGQSNDGTIAIYRDSTFLLKPRNAISLTCLWQFPPLHVLPEHVVDLWQHVGQAGGEDDPAAEAGQGRDELGKKTDIIFPAKK